MAIFTPRHSHELCSFKRSMELIGGEGQKAVRTVQLHNLYQHSIKVSSLLRRHIHTTLLIANSHTTSTYTDLDSTLSSPTKRNSSSLLPMTEVDHMALGGIEPKSQSRMPAIPKLVKLWPVTQSKSRLDDGEPVALSSVSKSKH